jgi:hypothetical protein
MLIHYRDFTGGGATFGGCVGVSAMQLSEPIVFAPYCT